MIYCHRRWQWYPHLIVADMGYIEAGTKADLRQSRQIVVVTRLKENMRLVALFQSPKQALCELARLPLFDRETNDF